MKNIDYFRDKKVAIVGIARSGLACANLLHRLGARVSVTDNQDNAATRNNAAKLISRGILCELGQHTESFIRGADFMVISPGVENNSPAVIWAQHLGIPVISEVEVGSILCPATVIAITGSNGKTTVATLVAKILEAKQKKAFLCGNIGNSFCGEIEKMQTGDFVSLEISSFQLERIKTFKPKIAVILNFTANHLDRYKDMQEYLQAKKRIFLYQDKADYLVLNAQDPILSSLAKKARAQVVFFEKINGLTPNESCVLKLAGLLGIDEALCRQVFGDFKGVQHRQEYVARINQVDFINDSKATTVESVIYALENINHPVILIAGGKDKGLDYRLLLPLAQKKIKAVVLIGEARLKIKEAFRGALPVSEAKSLGEAVRLAFAQSEAGDCVLLSPMCSSFDMFRDYEERGECFKRIVHELEEKVNNGELNHINVIQ